MKWITRERARVDRIACPWLISRFIDAKPEFLFVPANQVLDVAKREQAIPYDIPNVELGHHGPQCSFDAFVERYELADPALGMLARIVRGADTDDRGLDAGVGRAICRGDRIPGHEPRRLRQHGAPVPDVRRLLRVLSDPASERPRPRVLFVCLHGAAKSVIGAAHFRRLAAAAGSRDGRGGGGHRAGRGAGARAR